MPAAQEFGCGGWFVPEVEDRSTADQGYVHGGQIVLPRRTNVKLLMATVVQEVSTADQGYVHGGRGAAPRQTETPRSTADRRQVQIASGYGS